MLELDRHDALDLDAYRRVVSDGEPVAVPETLLEHVGRQREALLRHLATGVPAYGITTGLGYLASEPIAADEQPALQRSLLDGQSLRTRPAAPARRRPRRDAAQARRLPERALRRRLPRCAGSSSSG